MKRIFRFITNKNVIIGFLVFLQILLFFAVVLISALYDPAIGIYVLIGLVAISYLVSVYILGQRSVQPTYKLTWVAAILLFPIFGGVFYIYYNTRNYSKKQKIQYDDITNRICKLMDEKNIKTDQLTFNYLQSHGWANYKNSNVEFFQTGEDTFKILIEDLKMLKILYLLSFYY